MADKPAKEVELNYHVVPQFVLFFLWGVDSLFNFSTPLWHPFAGHQLDFGVSSCPNGDQILHNSWPKHRSRNERSRSRVSHSGHFMAS